MTKPDRLYWTVTLATLLVVAAGVASVRALGTARPAQQGTRAARPQGRQAPAASTPRISAFSRGARWRRRALWAQVQGDSAFERLKEPRPGDWLWSFRESGQTLEEYALAAPNHKRPGRETLHLLPFSDLSATQRGMLRPIQRHTARYFDTEVRLLPRRQLRRSWLDRRRGQYNADRIVHELAARVPDSSLGHFALVGHDLFGIGLNYVFGEALLQQRAGVYSLYRYGDEPRLLLLRALKLSAHEIGHMFGLQHCVFYSCVMNGVNSLQEMDHSPLHLCPVCLAKLHWNLKFDPAARYRRLAALYSEWELADQARFATHRAREVTSAGRE